MRISDWSSDVCSSDLLAAGAVMALDKENERVATFSLPTDLIQDTAKLCVLIGKCFGRNFLHSPVYALFLGCQADPSGQFHWTGRQHDCAGNAASLPLAANPFFATPVPPPVKATGIT